VGNRLNNRGAAAKRGRGRETSLVKPTNKNMCYKTNTVLLIVVFLILAYLYQTTPPMRENYLISTVRGVSEEERHELADEMNARWRTTAAL